MRTIVCGLVAAATLAAVGCGGGSPKGANKDLDKPKATATGK